MEETLKVALLKDGALSIAAALAGGERLTLDALYKKGLVEGEMIERWGFSATYDWPAFFARLAFDPKANFTPQDMWRLSVGTRF